MDKHRIEMVRPNGSQLHRPKRHNPHGVHLLDYVTLAETIDRVGWWMKAVSEEHGLRLLKLSTVDYTGYTDVDGQLAI